MAKDLPYFKFFCSEWSDGDITLEDYETQGLFINVCSYYWSNNCNLELIKLKKRFRNDANLNNLIEAKIIKINGTFVSISFLDKQLIEREEQSSTKSRGGKASAEAKRLLKIKQQFSTNSTDNQHVLNYSSTESQHVLKSCSTESQVLRKEEIREDKIIEYKITDNINTRKLKFAQSLIPFVSIYGNELIRNFCDYWSEPNKSNTKFRQELEKTWDTERRLKTWNQNNFGNTKKTKEESFDKLQELTKSIRDQQYLESLNNN